MIVLIGNKLLQILSFMRIILIALVILLVCSCSDDMERSIFESFPLDELNKVMVKHPKFEELYDDIQKTNMLLKDTQKAKFLELTYKRVFHIDTLLEWIQEKQLDDFRKVCKMYEYKIDSIANSFIGREDIPEYINEYIKNRYMDDGAIIIKEFINPQFKIFNELVYELKDSLAKTDSLAFEYWLLLNPLYMD